VQILHSQSELQDSVHITRCVLRANQLPIPLVLLEPQHEAPCACVIAVAQEGKAGFLELTSDEIAQLLTRGVAVCLPDLPGTGETSPDSDRGRNSAATSISSSRLMLGGTIVGDRLRDLLSLVDWLRTHDAIDGERIAIWGDSFAPVNPSDQNVAVPLGVDAAPRQSEPLGAMLSLLGGLFDSRVKAVLSQGGLVSLRSVLSDQFVYVPHDVIVPGALTAGDLAAIAAALDGTPVRIEGVVDGANRQASDVSVQSEWERVMQRGSSVVVSAERSNDYIEWLIDSLAPDP
jgi:hypothetical protein